MRTATLVALSLGAAALAWSAGYALADNQFAPSARVAPLPGGHFLCDVTFGFDQIGIGSAGSAELDRAVRAIETNRDALIVLDGHTDAAGADVYNTGLAIRRAEVVKDGLVARGVDPDRVVIAVYGENQAQGGIDREDRRVDLWMTYAVSMDDIVERSLVAGDLVVWTKPLTQRELEREPDLTAWRERPRTRAVATRPTGSASSTRALASR